MGARAWAQCFADLLFPTDCAACGSPAASPPLCHACNDQLDALTAAPACDRCGFPLPTTGNPCPHCRGKGVYPLDRVARLAIFREPIRSLVHRMKYRNGWPVAEFLADRLLQHQPARNLLGEADALTPVPLHRSRQRERGYNQADVIASRLARRCALPVARAIERVRPTASQAEIHSHAKRLANVRGAFALSSAAVIRGKHVVLIDDVMTSGATLRAAARALNQAEPASISAILIANADPKGRNFELI